MKLGYVCTSFRDAGFAEAALRTLHAQQGSHEIHAVVVDNGCSEADLARLRAAAQSYPHVEVVTGQGNVGYFRGLNLGIERLRASAPEVQHMVIGNNDLEFPEGFADSLERGLEVFERWAVVGPDLVTPGGVHQNPHVRLPITRGRKAVWWTYYQSYPLARAIAWFAKLTHRFTARPERVHGTRLSREAGPMILGYGACYILGPRFFEQFARLYAPTVLMQEEYFVSVQLATVGQQVYYDPRFVVRHRDHSAIGLLPVRHLWELSRDSYRLYRRHEGMTEEERVRAVARDAHGIE